VHLPGEELSVSVHGRAVIVDTDADRGFRQALLDIYVPLYGESWEAQMLDGGAMYARIEAARMFTYAAS
jgi:hypothetical protein